MDKFFEIPILYDYYGDFLTDKQKQAIYFYYNLNYSLAEIGEKMGITRQGVRDTLVRSEEALYNFEKKLKLVEKFNRINKVISDSITGLKKAQDHILDRIAIDEIKKVQAELEGLLEEN
jgi:hypothetical protein